MKRFKEFLREWKEDKSLERDVEQNVKRIERDHDALKDFEELDKAEAEEDGDIVTEGGGSPFEDDGGVFYNGDTGEVCGFEKNDSDDFVADDDYLGEDEKKKEPSDTFKFLNDIKNSKLTYKDFQNGLQHYMISGDSLYERSDKFLGKYVKMTDDQVQEFLNNINEKKILKKRFYNIKDDGGVWSSISAINSVTGEPDKEIKPSQPVKSPAVMKRLCNCINDIFETKPEMKGVKFWYADAKGSKDKVLTMTTNLGKSSMNDKIYDFTDAEYVPVDGAENKNLRERIEDELTETKDRIMKKLSKRDNSVIGFEKGHFTKDGVKLDDEENEKFLTARNGMPSPKNDKYWNTFHFMSEGSKIGKSVGSFSLPPGATCLAGVPCAHQGCYAYKSFRNPTVRGCWISNWMQLREGNDETFERFVTECTNFINGKNYKPTGAVMEAGKKSEKAAAEEAGPRMKFFRFHVSGDVDIGQNKQKYINAICKIASNCSGTQFWTYTKDYASWQSAPIPSNLTVLMSAWGDFRPNAEMSKKHPVAFLYDENDEDVMNRLKEDGVIPRLHHYDEKELSDDDKEARKQADIQAAKDYEKKEHTSEDPVVFCPCSDPTVKQHVTCEMCGLCHTRSAHHNVAFHKH